ncbi:3-hydroxyacyl-CoA dehydrogenase family protein [Ktedonosporobacter rubrisoli]|uniref:3-hydroxyacyl-CoA dehydrogenase family protein n=1 Tax=Ktedonosporobacter rubrisoli TaxID=2509675 RepID=A0A4V0YZA7_KTERU|nr:3-hydroxyacyl-CoA dehydrogenase NAD-binding domain-containing protein [Ktedonosporobacter rubrisoli]QBD79061.1 3-hydroxyacyl-CoA dehydrogenase family protein [Ktedonosporobacter rubrisoli]
MTGKPFTTISIIGAGTMGAQIALLCAKHGYQVWLFSRSQHTLVQATSRHSQELESLLQAGQISPQEQSRIPERIQLSTDLQETVARADLVIENVPEVLELKRELFARLDALCPPHTILATDSSSINITEIEDVTQRREKVLNLHFVSPVWDDSLVELMRGTATTDETIASVRKFARSISLVPFVLLKESSGFLLGRVWRSLRQASLRVVDEGVATPEDVDRAWMISTKMPIGPFGLMDMVGMDVLRDVDMSHYNKSGNPADAPARIVQDKIERGELGIKTGKGFYTYPKPAFQSPDWLKGNED